MTRLMRTSEVNGLPVVTFAGDDVAQVKDVIYSPGGGAVAGFTLAGRGLLAGPLKKAVSWHQVAGLGPDAVMVRDEDAFDPIAAVLDAAAAGGSSAATTGGGNVLGDRVLTDSGVDLGVVVDVVIDFADDTKGPSGLCEVVGYEIEASESLAAKSSKGSKRTLLLVPLPDTLAVSGENLIVPSSAEEFVTHDLAGFGASVAAFRAQLKGER